MTNPRNFVSLTVIGQNDSFWTNPMRLQKLTNTLFWHNKSKHARQAAYLNKRALIFSMKKEHFFFSVKKKI